MIAVAGGKGGCGKTTTTACLARAMAADGATPTVVDADVDMPDLHVVAGASREPGLGSLVDAGRLEAAAQSPVELPGVRLVAAGTDAADGIDAALARLGDPAEPVLVDTPAGASPAVASPLRAADATVLVSTPTRRSLEAAAKTAAMARTLDAPVLGCVLTRSDGSIDPRPLLDCRTLAHVPAVPEPLGDDRVRAAYAHAAKEVTERNIYPAGE